MPKGSRFIWDTSAPILPVWLRAMPEAIVGHAFYICRVRFRQMRPELVVAPITC